jgi:hypothetical protein
LARELQAFDITTPAGTAKATPQVTNLSLGSRAVREVRVLIPPGPRGEVGFALGSSGVMVIPINPGQFVVTDDEHISLPLEGLWDSGSWQITTYNTGHYPHTLTFSFLVDPAAGPDQGSVPAPIPASALLVR